MKPMRGYVLTKADLAQKKHHKIAGTDIELYIETDFNNNYRERNPNYAQVLYVPDSEKYSSWDGDNYSQNLQPGDRICVQHFQLIDDRKESKSLINDGTDDLFLVDLREVYFKDNNGTPEMLGSFAICEYYGDPGDKTSTGLIIPTNVRKGITRATKLAKIVSLPDSEYSEGLKVGDIVYYMDYADYKFNYNETEYLKIPVNEMVAKYEQ